MVWLLKSINCWLPKARRVYLGKNCCELTLALCSFPRQVLLMVTRDMICIRMRHWGIFVVCFPTSLAVWLHYRHDSLVTLHLMIKLQTIIYSLLLSSYIKVLSSPVCQNLSRNFSVAHSVWLHQFHQNDFFVRCWSQFSFISSVASLHSLQFHLLLL